MQSAFFCVISRDGVWVQGPVVSSSVQKSDCRWDQTDTVMEGVLFKTHICIKISAAAANGGMGCLHLIGHMTVVFLFLSTARFHGICF